MRSKRWLKSMGQWKGRGDTVRRRRCIEECRLRQGLEAASIPARPQPMQNGTVQPVSRNGSSYEPIIPRSWYRRHPHSPSWL